MIEEQDKYYLQSFNPKENCKISDFEEGSPATTVSEGYKKTSMRRKSRRLSIKNRNKRKSSFSKRRGKKGRKIKRRKRSKKIRRKIKRKSLVKGKNSVYLQRGFITDKGSKNKVAHSTFFKLLPKTVIKKTFVKAIK